MSQRPCQVVDMTEESIINALAKSLESSEDIEDYTYEERYCKGYENISKPKQDQVDQQHFTRLETIFTRSDWEVFSVFMYNCKAHPHKVAAVWLDDDGNESVRYTYHNLYEKARIIAAEQLSKYKLKKGDKVLLVYEPCINFFPAFWACIGEGIIAVPVCPPDPFNPDSDATDKLIAIAKDCEPKLILTSRLYKDSIAAARTFLGTKYIDIMKTKDNILDFGTYLWVATDIIPYVSHKIYDFKFPVDNNICENDIAFLQYTSGSTGSVKGVIVQHRVLAANCMSCALLTQGLGSVYVYQFSLGVSWLPTFHDMGLIGFHVAPMLIGGTMVYFSPINFIQNPILWLRVMSRFRHVSTGGPPFALDLCCRRVTPKDLEEIDLSGIDVLILGAEPIRVSFMIEFAKRFSTCGFKPRAYMTCYGMAENVLHVSGKWSNKYEPRILLVDSTMLKNNELGVYKDLLCAYPDENKEWPSLSRNTLKRSRDDIDTQWLVSSGELIQFSSLITLADESHQDLISRKPHFYRKEVSSFIAIVNPDTQEELPEGCIGEIWICGPSKTAGYWNKDDINKNIFRAKLKSCVRNDTKRLLKWAKSGIQYRKNKGNRFEYTLFTRNEILNATYPLLCLMRNSISDDGEVEWLRSGDMGVIYDGHLFITGRIKDMIIIRGTNYYADDIEHSISTGKSCTNDITPVVDEKIATSRKLLSYIRFGSAVAYSITITSDNNPNHPARLLSVEGEHLAIIVELQYPDVFDGMPKKHGNQAPMWKRLLLRYGENIIGGMSSIYEYKEDILLKNLLGQNDNDSTTSTNYRNLSCTQRAKIILQKCLILGIKQIVNINTYLRKDKKYATNNTIVQEYSNNNDNTIDKEQNEMDKQLKHLPMDEETTKIRDFYNDEQLNDISNCIRRVISTKFMLIVGKITFLSPKSIKKTTSGKKRRSDMIKAIEGGYLDHRIIKVSYTKQFEKYVKLCGNIEISENKVGTGTSHFATTGTRMSENIFNHNAKDRSLEVLLKNDKFDDKYKLEEKTTQELEKNIPDPIQFINSNKKYSTVLEGLVTANSSDINRQQDDTTNQKYGGTVGISLDNQTSYKITPRDTNTDINTVTQSHLLSMATSPTIDNQLQDNNNPTERVQYTELLPAYVIDKGDGNGLPLSREDAYKHVQKMKEHADNLTFEVAKERVLQVIVHTLQDSQPTQCNCNNNDITATETETTRATSCDTHSLIDDDKKITVEYLREMSTLSEEEQQSTLDEYGLDSLAGFKLAKSLASEFNIPTHLMGPHLFLQDPTIDGIVRVMVQLSKLHALRIEEEFNQCYNNKNKHIEYDKDTIDKMNLISHKIYRNANDTTRMPYILGIGTAVPDGCAPQVELIQAMLPSMKMDRKSEERFLKIAANSGIQTRYSAQDSLEDVFWGKEGVNSGTDEFVDVRQVVYKREAVKLSIKAAADCLNDWKGTRIQKTDSERDIERLKCFLKVEENLRKKAQINELGDKAYDYIKKDTTDTLKEKTIQDFEEECKMGDKNSPNNNNSSSNNNNVKEEFIDTNNPNNNTTNLRNLASLCAIKTKRSITHVVAVTCTGVIVPGLEFHIMQSLGQPLNTQRLSIQFMGCFGAISGIRCAAALASENPNNRILVVCTELCSLHMQLNDKIDNLIATVLFGDGSGSFIVGCCPTDTERPLYAIHSCSSFVIPNTLDQMAWDMSKSGLLIGLAKEIAGEIFHNIGDFVRDMLKYCPDEKHIQHSINPKDCNLAIHPGGPLIINTIQNVLDIETDQNNNYDKDAPSYETWAILKEYGNMSSATLVYVLDRIRENKNKTNRWTPTLAFGPGLSIEGSLLKACF